MSGWKTWAGGIGLIASGIGIIAASIRDGNYGNLGQAFSLVSAGIAAIGIGHKIEKAAK